MHDLGKTNDRHDLNFLSQRFPPLPDVNVEATERLLTKAQLHFKTRVETQLLTQPLWSKLNFIFAWPCLAQLHPPPRIAMLT